MPSIKFEIREIVLAGLAIHQNMIAWMRNLQFHGHHSYFRKDFHMLLAVTVMEGEIKPPYRTLLLIRDILAL